MSTIRDDARIDPRIRQVFGAFPAPVNPGDAASREQLVEEAGSEEAAAMRLRWDAFLERCDTEEIAPSAGLAITTCELASEPDGNMINIRLDGRCQCIDFHRLPCHGVTGPTHANPSRMRWPNVEAHHSGESGTLGG